VSAADVRVEVREYRVTAWPADLDDHPDADMFDIHVRPTFKPGMWAVTTRFAECLLTLGGNWTWDLPQQFRQRHYRPLDEAIDAARAVAPTMKMNGWTVDALAAEVRARREAQ